MKPISYQFRFVRAVMTATLAACICYGAGPASGVTAEDDEFESFSRYVGHLRREIIRLAKTPAETEAMERDEIRLLGVTLVEFRVMERMFEGLQRDLQALDSEGRTYVEKEQAKRRRPDLKTLESFEERRHRILVSARAALQRQLSPGSWQSVEYFVRKRSPRPSGQGTGRVIE